jgi:hypothetical protein
VDCRLELQQRLSDALSHDLLVVQDVTFADPHSVVAHLFIGKLQSDPESALEGSVTSELLALPVSPTTNAKPTQSAFVKVVAVLRNFPRSFKEIAKQLGARIQPFRDVQQAVKRRRARRRLLQLDNDRDQVTFAFVDLNSTALPVCGNGVCEYGEAVGTFAYPEAWFCREDCPFVLTACPSQVQCPLVASTAWLGQWQRSDHVNELQSHPE